jgi:hypothetical protein
MDPWALQLREVPRAVMLLAAGRKAKLVYPTVLCREEQDLVEVREGWDDLLHRSSPHRAGKYGASISRAVAAGR